MEILGWVTRRKYLQVSPASVAGFTCGQATLTSPHRWTRDETPSLYHIVYRYKVVTPTYEQRNLHLQASWSQPASQPAHLQVHLELGSVNPAHQFETTYRRHSRSRALSNTSLGVPAAWRTRWLAPTYQRSCFLLLCNMVAWLARENSNTKRRLASSQSRASSQSTLHGSCLRHLGGSTVGTRYISGNLH